MKKIFVLSMNDLRNIRRDPMLLLIIFGPIVLTVSFRFGVPFVGEWLSTSVGFELVNYSELIVGFTLLLVPFLVGVLVGLLMLDEKDEHLLFYYAVTPLTRQGYLYYRLAAPVVLSFFLSVFMIAFIGLIEMELVRMIPVALVNAMQAPLIALAMAVFASNKVEGLAISKGAGVILAVPFIIYFISSHWVWLGFFLPTFWVAQAFFFSFSFSVAYIVCVLGGIVIHFVWLRLLLAKFQRAVF